MRHSIWICAAVVALGTLTACPPKENPEQPKSSGGGEKRQEKIALKPPPLEKARRPEGMNALRVSNGTISKDQVVEYFKTHNLPMNYTATSDFHVESVDMMTAKQVSDRLAGESTGLADDERLAFVTLAGMFTFTGPPKSSAANFKRAYAVFDVKNGNLMMVGTLEPNREGGQTTTAKQ